MTKAELMCYVGKKVHIYFKDGEKGIYGTLGYVDEFSAKYDYRKPNCFYIGNTSFKVSHVRKLTESEDKVIENDREESDDEFMCRVMSKTINKSTDDRNFIGGF